MIGQMQAKSSLTVLFETELWRNKTKKYFHQSNTPMHMKISLKMLDFMFLRAHTAVYQYLLITWVVFSHWSSGCIAAERNLAQKLLLHWATLQRNNANLLSDLPAVILICHESSGARAQKWTFVRLIRRTLRLESGAENYLSALCKVPRIIQSAGHSSSIDNQDGISVSHLANKGEKMIHLSTAGQYRWAVYSVRLSKLPKWLHTIKLNAIKTDECLKPMIFREEERTCAVTFPEDFIQTRWERKRRDALDNGEKSHHLSIYGRIIKVWRDSSQLGWSDRDGRVCRQDFTVELFAFGLYVMVTPFSLFIQNTLPTYKSVLSY